VIEDLQASRDHGLEHLDDLAEEWSTRIEVPRETIRFYLTNNIHYLLDDACLRGLDVFYRLAAKCGALPKAAPLTML
jgi:chorismate dehydratase